MMEIAFELIREGGIRVPSVIGQTLGIVGALILGQAAVSAGLVSPMLVIVVSITGLGSFAIPNYSLSLSVRVIRFAFIFAGAVLGFYGLSLMTILLMTLACSMKSFGVPYFSPVAPKTKENKDVVFRRPLWSQNSNPDTLNTPDPGIKGNNKKLWITKDGQDDSNREAQQSDQ
jgi:spore germination protein KA